jgi:hypothetical protein
MNEKISNNQFKFSLYQEDILFCERSFNADQFNPFTRYSVDIREMLPHFISKMQKMLSQKKYDVVYEFGGCDYDLFEYVKSRSENRRIVYDPKPKKNTFDGKVIKGVEFKMGLYINENPIVERFFYVDGFNPVSRYSLEVVECVCEIADIIFDEIKKTDIGNMWDDYDLINKKGLQINQIRELPLSKRRYLLRNM